MFYISVEDWTPCPACKCSSTTLAVNPDGRALLICQGCERRFNVVGLIYEGMTDALRTPGQAGSK
jgi:uncharacterized protein YbaR (Trm112 family)